jgi:hypothetical protein
MKPKGMANQPEQNLSIESRGTPTESGLDVETKIFSASGRGGVFFLTSLLIELIDWVVGVIAVAATIRFCTLPRDHLIPKLCRSARVEF